VQDELLHLREQSLNHLRTIYEERQHLNQITMSIMLPRQPKSHCGEHKSYYGSTDCKIHCIERYGGGCMLTQSAELVRELNRLKANLVSERRLLVQLHEKLLLKVLPSLRSLSGCLSRDAASLLALRG
jgi:hypothetical protein